MAAFCLGASFGYAVLAETDVPPEGQDWSTRPDGADLSPGAQATDATAPTDPFADASAMTTLVDQQAEQNTETVAQEVEEMLWPEFGAYNDTYEGLAAFWGDDIISNFFANIGQLLGKWLSELINGWVADAVQLLTGFLRIFVLNPNIAVNGLSSVPGGNGQPVDDISPYVRQGADVMYGIAVDLLLLLFILCIWKYWAEAAWRGGGNLMGAVGRLIFTAGLMLAWPTIYAFEIQITNEMIKTIYFNSADQVAMLDAAMAAAVKGGLVAGAGLLANATAPVAGQVLGGILAGGPGGLVLGTVGSIVAFAGLIIYLILGGVLIAQLVYILVLKAIQTALLTAQYMFAPIFLVFFAVPDTENVTSGFVRSFVEVSLWTFVWVGLLKIMVIIILSDFNPWGKLIVAIGVLQIMIQVPSFLARAQISPMSDFISAGLITGGLLGAGKALGNTLGHRAMHLANAVGNYSYGGAKGAPKSQAAELRGLGNDVMNPELLSGIRETQKTGKVPGQKKGPGEGGIPTDANGQPLKPIDPNAKKPGDPNAKKPGDPNAPGAGKNLNGLGPGLNTKIDPLTGKPIGAGAGAGDGAGAGAGAGANVANAGLKPATNTGFSGKLDPATGQMVGADGKPLAGGGFGGAVSSFAAGGLMAAANAASLGNPTKTTGDENKTALNGGDPTKGLNPASAAKLNDSNNKVGAQGDKAVKTTVAGGDKNAAANLAPAAAASVTGKVNDKGEGKGAGKNATATDGKGKDLLPGFNAANIGSAMAGMNLGSTPGAKDGSSEVEVEFDKDGNPLNAAMGKGAVTGLNGLKPDNKGGAGLAGGNAANQKQTLAAGKTDGSNLNAAQGGGDTKLTAKQPGVSPVNQKSVVPPLASIGLANFASATATGKVIDPTVALSNGDDTLVSGDPGEPLGSTAKSLQSGSLNKTGGGRTNNGISAKIDPATGQVISTGAANQLGAQTDAQGKLTAGPAGANRVNVGPNAGLNAGANANQFNFGGTAVPATAGGASMVGMGNAQGANVAGVADFTAEDSNAVSNAPGFNAGNVAGSIARTVAQTAGLQGGKGGVQNAGFSAKIDPVTGKATSVAPNANLNNATADVSGRVVSGPAGNNAGNATAPIAGANANQFNFAGSSLPTTPGSSGMVGLGQTGYTYGLTEVNTEDGSVAGNPAGAGVGASGFNAANIAGSLAQTVAKTGGLPTGGAQNAGFTAKIDPATGKATSVAANANLNNATADVSGRVVSGSGNVTQPGAGVGNVNAGGNANQFNFAGSALPITAGGAGMTGLGQTGTTNVSGVAEFSAEDGNVAGNVASAGAGVPGFNAANIAGSLAQSVAQTKGLQTGGAQNAGFTAKIDPVTGKATSVAANANLNNATVDVSGRVVSGSGNVTQPGAGVGNGNVGGNANQFNFGGSALPTTAGGAGITGLGQTGATNVSGVAEFSAEDGNVASAGAGVGVPGFNAANIAGSLAQSVAQTKGLQTGGAQNAGFTAKIDPVTGKATSVAANANLNNATADVSGRVVSGSGNVTQPGAGVGNGNAGGNANQFNFGGSAVPTTAGGAGMTGLGHTPAANVSGVAEFSNEEANVAASSASGFNAANIAGSLANSVAQTRGMQTGGVQNASFTAKIDPATGKATSVGPAATLGNVDATMRGGVSSSPAASNSAQQPGGQFNFAGSVPNMNDGQVNPTNFSAVVEGIGGNDSVTPSAGLNPGSLAGAVGQLSGKGNQQQTGGTGPSFRATIDNNTGRSTSVNGTPTIDATIQNQAGVGGVGSGSPQITSQFTASNSGSGTPNIPPTNTTIGGGDMGGGDGGNGGLNVSGAAATVEGPKASTFANRMQSGYIQVPGRAAAAAMRMAEGGSLMQSDTGVATNVYDTHGHLMQVRVGQGASDEQISMQILSGAFGELMSSDAAAYDAARQSAIDAGEHKPQGLAERAASGIMAYNGGSWSQTAAAKQRFARSMAKHASLGAQAYVSGGEGNAYTEYLNNRYGVMDEEQQAWAVHLMTDDSSPESGWSWKNKPASEGLIQSGVGINSASRAVAANNSVMKAQPWLKGAGIRGGVEYMRSMAKDVIPEGTPDGIRDAWFGSVAQDVPAEVANTWGALTLAMGEQVCAEYQTVDTVAAMVGPNGRPEDYVGAYHALKGGEEAVKRVSARYGDTRAVSGDSQSVSMSGGSSAGGSQQVVSSGSVQTSVSGTSFGAPANGQADVDFFLDGPQVSAAPINPGSLSVPNLNNPHGGATIANVRMQQGNASSGGVQNTSVRLPGGNVGTSQGQVQIGSVQGGGNGGGNLPDQQVMVDVETSVSGQVIDPGSVQSAALQSAIGQFGSSSNMVQQVVADLRASGMNWNQIIDANKDDSDPGKYAFLETAVQAYSQNSASMPAVAAAATAVGPSKVSMQDVEIVQNMIDSDPRWDARSIDSSSVYTAKAIVQAHYQEPQTYGQPVLTKDYVDSIRTDPRFIPRPLPVRDSQGSVVRHDQTPVPKDRLMKRILEQALGRDSFGRPRA